MTHKEIETLYNYDEWATRRILEIVSSLNEEQFKKDMGSSHGGIHGTLVHIYGADWIWFERWKGNSPATLIKTDDLPDRNTLRDGWERHFSEIRAFISMLNDRKLDSPHSYKDMKGNPHTELLYYQMQHKVNHSAYHRGQVVTMVR